VLNLFLCTAAYFCITKILQLKSRFAVLYIIAKKCTFSASFSPPVPPFSCLFYCLFFLSFSLSAHLFSYLPWLSFFPSPFFLHLCAYFLIQLTPLPCRVPIIWLGEQADGSSIATLFLLSKSVTCFGFLERRYQAQA